MSRQVPIERAPRRGRCAPLARWALAALAGLAASGALPGCGGEGGAADADQVRWRVAALFARNKEGASEEALALLEPLLGRTPPDPADLLRAATVLMSMDDEPERDARIHALLDEAGRLARDGDVDLLAAIAFNRGNLLRRQGHWEDAAAAYRAVLALRPGDIPTHIQLAEVASTLGRTDEQIELLEAVRARGPEYGPSAYLTATHMLGNLLLQMGVMEGDDDLAARGESLLAESRLIRDDQLVEAADTRQLERSGLGAPPVPVSGRPPDDVERAGPFARLDEPRELARLDGAHGLLAADLDRDGRPDVLVWGRGGLLALLGDGAGGARPLRIHDRPVLFADAADLDEAPPPERPDKALTADEARRIAHPALEILAVEPAGAGGPGQAGGTEGAPALYAWNDAGDGYVPLPAPPTPDAVRSAAFVDFDHDGDLDVALATARGAVLLRNDGTEARLGRTLVDATPPVAAALGPSTAVVPEDLDGDQDVDLLVVRPDGLAALSSLRRGRFEDATDAWELHAGAALAPPVAVLDVDADGRPDLLGRGAGGELLWRRRADGRYRPPTPLGPTTDTRAVPRDVDLDGSTDLIVGRGDELLVHRGPLPTGDTAAARSTGGAVLDVAAADLDRDGDEDVIALRGDTVVLVANAGPTARGLPFHLAGRKDNTHGVGAIVEVLAGGAYRRVRWSGEEQLLGLGPDGTPYEIRATWPNGVVQYEPHLESDLGAPFVQPGAPAGSCPFLYTWNGETFVFVTDVLGATPLGLPMTPDMLVPPDHEEYVKVRGDQLVPDADGRLRLALTEELREVTYLDRARLHAIDHPAATEIQPDEAFAFPPFPPHHVHTLTEVRAPARVTASDGSDVTALLARVDDRHARPWTPLSSQLRGLTEPWHLDIELVGTDPAERAALAAAPRIRLALTGWLEWGDASVNMAAARHPVHAFEVPRLWVPDTAGVHGAEAGGGTDEAGSGARPGADRAQAGWRPAGPPIGFPAGKTKTMVVDVTDVIDRADPRLRLTTTLQLSWDAIRVVLDGDDAPFRDTPLEPVAARLVLRGFSRPLPTRHGELPLRFDWDELDRPRWNQHPGAYTRYGPVLPLLSAVDDELVVFGAGDAVFVDFDAGPLPPLPAGWTRDWLLHLDGWAKDGDHNTLAAEAVEPLPFHAMSRYPPPPGEQAPDRARHEAYRRAWNTRPGATFVVPLPARRTAHHAATHEG